MEYREFQAFLYNLMVILAPLSFERCNRIFSNQLKLSKINVGDL